MVEPSTQSQEIHPSSLDKIFNALAASDLSKFEAFFRRMRNAYPEDLGRACVRYLGKHGLDDAGRKMAYWLSSLPSYGAFLLDGALLNVQEAEQAAKIMRVSDGRFSVKMLGAIQEELGVDALNRALVILEATGDKAPIIPRLLTLTGHTDERIRSKAVKALCELRPNQGLVKRQLQSEDPRVRANAVEALWGLPGEEARHIFCFAENDAHHRVVVNALLGLHYQRDVSALDRLHKLTSHKSAYFRAAAIWALDRLRDRNSIPVLEELSQTSLDPDLRQKATRTLAEMFVPETSGAEKEITPEAEPVRTSASQADEAAENGREEKKEEPQPSKAEFEAPVFKTF